MTAEEKKTYANCAMNSLADACMPLRLARDYLAALGDKPLANKTQDALLSVEHLIALLGNRMEWHRG